MIHLAQLGFLAGLVILIGLVAWHYPLIVLAGAGIAALVRTVWIGRM
ncbi:hypothetical protein [Bradyrhizobium sp. USDA 4452]